MQLRKKFAIGATVSVTVMVVLATTLFGQDNNGNPSILQAVQAVHATLDGLVSTLASLVTTVNNINTATTEGNVLATPTVVVFPPEKLTCAVTNLNAAVRNATVQLMNGNTGSVLTQVTTNIPTNITLQISHTPPASGTRVFCKVTVNNGVKSDLRAGTALFAADNASDKDVVVAQ
jgi:hypothetical protein